MRVKTYTEALRLANAAGMDAANRRMKKAGRTVWSLEDGNHCVEVVDNILTSLGYDVRNWIALAGVPRNEPDEPAPPRKSRKRRGRAKDPVQLDFAFA